MPGTNNEGLRYFDIVIKFYFIRKYSEYSAEYFDYSFVLFLEKYAPIIPNIRNISEYYASYILH